MKKLTTLAAASALAMTSSMAWAGGLADPMVEDTVDDPAILPEGGLGTGTAIVLGVAALAVAAALIGDDDDDDDDDEPISDH